MITRHLGTAAFVAGMMIFGVACIQLRGESDACEQCLQPRFFRDSEEIAKYIVGDGSQENELLRGPKGKQNTAILLNGLAQSCAHLGAMANAQTQQDKKQGILNVMSTVLDITAQLVMHNEKETAATKEATCIIQDDVVKALQELTNCLIDASKENVLRDPSLALSPLLKELEESKTPEEQQSRLKKMLLSADKARLYITELLALLNKFLISEYEALSALIKAYVIDKINDWSNGKPAVEQKIDGDEKQELRTPHGVLQEHADYIVYRTLLLGATQIFTKKEILDAQREVLGDTTRSISSVVSMVLTTDVLLLEKLLNDEMTKAFVL